MVFLCTVLNILCITIVIGKIILDHKAAKVQLFSLRNVFITGFLYFQSFGIFSWLFDRDANGWWAYLVTERNLETTLIYCFMLNAFVISFFVCYELIRIRVRPYIPKHPLRAKDCFRVASILTSCCIGSWLVGFFVLQDLLQFIATGIGVAATGFAAWGWSSRVKHPTYIAYLVIIAALSCFPQFTEFGRRGMVSIAGVIAWVVFYRVSFSANIPKLMIYSAIVVLPMLIVLAKFSEVRGKRPKSVQEAVELMVPADTVRGFSRIATFQGAAPISIWCLHHHPRRFKYRHCHTIGAFFWIAVPRSIWAGKPQGLGINIPKMANLKRVGGLNVGAGLIGHASAEGGWYALFLYAFLLALLFKFLDSLVLAKATPLYRVPLAAALGDIFATSRGEVNFFLDIMALSILVAFVLSMMVVRLFVGRNRG